jgi:hypothetical protein
MTEPEKEKAARAEVVGRQEEESLELSKEMLEDLEAPVEVSRDVRGQGMSRAGPKKCGVADD